MISTIETHTGKYYDNIKDSIKLTFRGHYIICAVMERIEVVLLLGSQRQMAAHYEKTNGKNNNINGGLKRICTQKFV